MDSRFRGNDGGVVRTDWKSVCFGRVSDANLLECPSKRGTFCFPLRTSFKLKMAVHDSAQHLEFAPGRALFGTSHHFGFAFAIAASRRAEFDMSRSTMTTHRTEHLFVIRMWQEPGAAELSGQPFPSMPNDPRWRGSVQHIRSGERVYFTHLPDLNEFVLSQLARPHLPAAVAEDGATDSG